MTRKRRAAEPDADDLETSIASPFRDGGRVVGWRCAAAALLLTIAACDPVQGPAVSDPPPAARDGGVDARPGDAASALCVLPDGGTGGGGGGGNDVCNACSQAAPLPGQRCPTAACDCSTGCCCCR